MGTYEEVLAYEKKMGMATGNEVANVQIEPHHDRVLLRIYEAPDGFRGTYDEVVEHEKKLGSKEAENSEAYVVIPAKLFVTCRVAVHLKSHDSLANILLVSTILLILSSFFFLSRLTHFLMTQAKVLTVNPYLLYKVLQL